MDIYGPKGKTGGDDWDYWEGTRALPNEEDLIVPGMKRHLYLDRRRGTLGQSVAGESDSTSVPTQPNAGPDDETSSLLMQSQQSSIDAGPQAEVKDQAAVASAMGWMKKR